MPWILRPKAAITLPIEAEALRPDALSSLSATDVARTPIWIGNRAEELGELFAVEGDGTDDQLILEGDARNVHFLGQGMASGTLTIRGDAGHELGARMLGGTIDVQGSVGDYAGAEMRGGSIRIWGSAGNHLGAAYPGSRLGMREGVIVVVGNVGDDAGLSMRRGLIVIHGQAGDTLGRAMIAGSIFAFGPIGARAGAGMKRGTLALFGGSPMLLPTFFLTGRSRPPFVTIYLDWLRNQGAPVPNEVFSGTFEKFNGDLVEKGQGEILVWADSKSDRAWVASDPPEERS
jgi:formylmethanofuran dehydrogenase subunit C